MTLQTHERAAAKPKSGVRRTFYLIGTGIAMGSADVVPGVSGGTMAFILGVYEELIAAIKSVNLALVRLLLQARIRESFDHVNGKFLLPLGSGIVGAFLTLAHPITWLLEHHRPHLFAFFFGLIVASILSVGARIRWNAVALTAAVAGTAAGYVIVGLVPMVMPHDPLTLFLSGAVAICAMILPGISGSFILLILGQYGYIMNALKSLDVSVLAPVMAGIVIGITSFSRALNLLLRRWHTATIAALVGFMIGSLRKIWPFKEVLEYTEDSQGQLIPLIENNILPDTSSGTFWAALGLCLVGFIIICALDHAQSKANPFVRLFIRPKNAERR